MTLRPIENQLVWILERWRRWVAIGFCVLLVCTAAVSFGAAPKDVPADAIRIEVTMFGATKVILAREAREPVPMMGALIVRYVGYHDNIWHTAGGVGAWVDVPKGPALNGIVESK